MKAVQLKFSVPVCLVGGGYLTREMLDEARSIAPVVVAADGAADRLLDWGVMPDAIIGDMDSIADAARWRELQCEFLQIDEQESTDFGKCLYATDAPFYLGVGFTGGRLDHSLAVLSTMLEASGKIVVLIGEAEVSTFVPPCRSFDFTVGIDARVSIYPITPVTGTISSALKWSIEGLGMQSGQQVGTSNIAIAPDVSVGFDKPGALLMLERCYLSELVRARTT